MRKSKLAVKQEIEKKQAEFASEIAGLSSDEIKGRIADMATAIETLEDQAEADEDLQDLKAKVKALSEPYTAPKAEIKLKMRYLGIMLEESGK